MFPIPVAASVFSASMVPDPAKPLYLVVADLILRFSSSQLTELPGFPGRLHDIIE